MFLAVLSLEVSINSCFLCNKKPIQTAVFFATKSSSKQQAFMPLKPLSKQQVDTPGSHADDSQFEYVLFRLSTGSLS
jgi:hypothetical protein